MKALIIILIIYINYAISIDINSNPKFSVKKYPKKVKPGNVQIINAGKYVKLQTKRPNDNKYYTAFPKINVKNDSSVPISQYFPSDSIVEQKPRVKKVLQDYTGVGLRSKRSVKNVPKSYKEVKKPAKPSDNIKHKKNELRKGQHGNKIGAKNSGTGRKVEVGKRLKTLKNTGTAGRVGSHKRGRKHKRQNLKVSRRLVAARDALIEEYPYVVSIQKDEEHWCAGALLNPRLVITTANCLWKANRMSRMEIRAGSRHTNRGGQVARIAEVMKHPGWGIRRDPDCDVALALLDRNFKLSNSLHSVDLPNRVMMPPFDDAWITSWGADRRDGVYDPPPQSLQVYHARLMDRDKCNNVTQRFGVIVTENFICLAQTGKRSPCTRDTGAPAVSDGVLWGLASWGIRKLCGTERFPAVFSYIASHSNMDFILNATQSLMADERYYPFLDRYPVLKSITTPAAS